MDEEIMMITLEFDEGQSVECEVLGTFAANDREYIALQPQDDTDDIYIYAYGGEDEDALNLIDIEDDDEFQAATAAFEAIMGAEEEEDEEA